MVVVGLTGCSGDECLGCAEGCTIAEDNFNRSNNANINVGAPFTWIKDVTGTAFSDVQIFGNRVAFFYDVEGTLTCSVGGSSASGVVDCTFELGGGDGEFVEVWLDGADKDNCLVGRLTVGTSASMDLIIRSSGSDSIVESKAVTAAAGGTFRLRLYHNASNSSAMFLVGDDPDDRDFRICYYETGSSIGVYSGITVGPHTETDIYADDFSYQELGDGENECPQMTCPPEEVDCAFCDDDTVPPVLQVVVSGVTGSGGCGNCSLFNGTYIVPYATTIGNQCYYFLLFDTPICTANSLTVWFARAGSGGTALYDAFFSQSVVPEFEGTTAYFSMYKNTAGGTTNDCLNAAHFPATTNLYNGTLCTISVAGSATISRV